MQKISSLNNICKIKLLIFIIWISFVCCENTHSAETEDQDQKNVNILNQEIQNSNFNRSSYPINITFPNPQIRLPYEPIKLPDDPRKFPDRPIFNPDPQACLPNKPRGLIRVPKESTDETQSNVTEEDSFSIIRDPKSVIPNISKQQSHITQELKSNYDIHIWIKRNSIILQNTILAIHKLTITILIGIIIQNQKMKKNCYVLI